MCVYKAVRVHISIKTPTGLLYFLVYDKDKEKQKDFKNVMSSVAPLYLPVNDMNH